MTSNGGLDFGGKLDHDANMGILKGFIPTRDRDSSTKFAANSRSCRILTIYLRNMSY